MQADHDAAACSGHAGEASGAGNKRQRREQQLDDLEAAAAQVVLCCRAVRATLARKEVPAPSSSPVVADAAAALAGAGNKAASTMPSDSQQQDSCSTLQQSVAKLRKLLDDFPLTMPTKWLQAPIVAPASASADIGSLLDGSSTFPLLALPVELLHHVVRLVGRDARLGCVQLRNAYGCPGTTLRQPLLKDSSSSVHDRSELIRGMLMTEDSTGLDDRSVREQLLRALAPPRDCWDILKRHKAHWPGHVTRLELSDDFNPDLELLRTIHSALPNLQQLKCAWPDFWKVGPAEDNLKAADHEVPQLSLLTQLVTRSSMAYAAVDYYSGDSFDGFDEDRSHEIYRFDAQHVVLLAPNLRHLEADLRHQDWGEELTELSQLAHLTSLYIRFGVEEECWEDMEEHVLALLSSAAGRLRSLTLKSAHHDLSQALPGVLETMTSLKTLRLWDHQAESGWMPSWVRMPQLRRLQLHSVSTKYSERRRWGSAAVKQESVAAFNASVQAGVPQGLNAANISIK